MAYSIVSTGQTFDAQEMILFGAPSVWSAGDFGPRGYFRRRGIDAGGAVYAMGFAFFTAVHVAVTSSIEYS